GGRAGGGPRARVLRARALRQALRPRDGQAGRRARGRVSAHVPVAARRPAARDERAYARNEALLAIGMIAPAVLFIVLLVGVPFGLAIYYSLHDVTTGGTAVKWVGLQHFVDLVSDRNFRQALGNTVLFTGGTLVTTLVLGTILAELLMRDFRGKWIVRFLILLPWTAPVALGLIGWLWMFDSVFSPMDWILRQVGLLGSRDAAFGIMPNLYWLGDRVLAKVSIILVNVWRILPLATVRSEEHTSELQSRENLVCRLLLEKKNL